MEILIYVFLKKTLFMPFPARECFLATKSDWYCQRESKKILPVGSVLEIRERGNIVPFSKCKVSYK
jgi:hypothetical protein